MKDADFDVLHKGSLKQFKTSYDIGIKYIDIGYTYMEAKDVPILFTEEN